MTALDFKAAERLDLLSIATIGQSQMSGQFTFVYCGYRMSDCTLILQAQNSSYYLFTTFLKQSNLM